MRARLPALFSLLIALPCASCTALIDLNAYSSATCTELRLDLFEIGSRHSGVLFEVRALDADDRLQCLVHLDPFGQDDNLSIRVPNALTTHETHLDFFADVNGNGVADLAANEPGGTDHSWVIEDDFVCADQDPTIANEFPHNFQFVSIDETSRPYTPISTVDAYVQIQGVDAPLEAFELRLVALIPGVGEEPPTERTVGLFRRPKVDPGGPRDGEPAFDVRIPGVVADFPFRVEMWNDTDGDQEYDPPPVDEAWALEISDTDIGVPTGDTMISPFPINTDVEPMTDIGSIYVTVIPD